MGRVTDVERRDVARRLRESVPEGGVFPTGDTGWSRLYRTLFGRYMTNQCAATTYGQVVERLADLIEPGEPKVKCVAEVKIDGERLEELVHDAAVKLTGIDRDALLALADEIERTADFDTGLDPRVLLSFSCRIREALGVERCV